MANYNCFLKPKYFLLYFCLLFAFVLSGCSSGQTTAVAYNEQEKTSSDSEHLKYGIPSKNGAMIVRRGYAVLIDTDKKEPLWVSYNITAALLNSPQLTRSNSFAPEPGWKPGYRAELSDYKGSGYDRGHMCPNADQSWSAETMKECFYLGNMCPQLHNLNAGKWGNLESKVRAFVKKQGEAWIVCGPVFQKEKNKQKTIGAGKVWVPAGFYKIVIYETKEGVKAIGYEMPHQNLTGELKQYIVKIRDIEKETGLNFLSKLPPNDQDKLELVVPASPEMLN